MKSNFVFLIYDRTDSNCIYKICLSEDSCLYHFNILKDKYDNIDWVAINMSVCLADYLSFQALKNQIIEEYKINCQTT